MANDEKPLTTQYDGSSTGVNIVRNPNGDVIGTKPISAGLTTNEIDTTNVETVAESSDAVSANQLLRTPCTRCKKDFDQPLIIPHITDADQGISKPLAEPKIFKLCPHCRSLQRQRSRRWQKKTKDKSGACRRCGAEIPTDAKRFVLCPDCRKNLRGRKASRAAQGKCVHCSGPLDSSILPGEDKSNKVSKAGNFKVCQRCRENDKIRRTNLERLGNCNRCAKPLEQQDVGKHKVCSACRTKKKKPDGNGSDTGSIIPTVPLLNNGVNGVILPNEMSQFNQFSQIPQQLPQQQSLKQDQFAQAQFNQAIAQQQFHNAIVQQHQQQQQQPRFQTQSSDTQDLQNIVNTVHPNIQ